MNFVRIWLAALTALLAGGLLMAGCGEKITIPQPQGLYSGSPYSIIDSFDDPTGPIALGIANNTLLVLSPDALTKRDQNYGQITQVTGLGQATAMCVEAQEDIVFLYEASLGRVSWYATNSLDFLGATEVPAVQAAVAMTTCPAGIELQPGARTFLYISDPDSLVVHRYAFDELSGLHSFGILCRADGDAARFVHEPLGLACDSQDSLLVCDQDTLRNWVIRFNSYPIMTDVTVDPLDQDPWRGRAALWDNQSGCLPHPAGDYVLGNAADCGQTDWTGGVSDLAGEFNRPGALAVDGSGRIFVADTGNDRIQIFDAVGDYVLLFGNPGDTPAPRSIGVVDIVSDPANNRVNFGAYVYILPGGNDIVLKYISNEQRNDEGLPPPDLP